MATADLTVIALGRPDPSASEYIAEIQRRLRAQDRVRFRLHAMGTVVEGNVNELLDLLERCIEAVTADCDRVSVSAKLDYRKGRSGSLDAKVASVEKRLGRAVKK